MQFNENNSIKNKSKSTKFDLKIDVINNSFSNTKEVNNIR